MQIQKLIPVVTSILIIIAVAILRDRSKTLAAILATMPINIPLALWVVFGAGNYDLREAESFTRALLPGIAATMAWIAVVFVSLHFGLRLLPAVLLGYVAWGALIAAFIRLGWLYVPQ
jgi:hypothetical protein